MLQDVTRYGRALASYPGSPKEPGYEARAGAFSYQYSTYTACMTQPKPRP